MKTKGKKLAWLLALTMLLTSVPVLDATPVNAEESGSTFTAMAPGITQYIKGEEFAGSSFTQYYGMNNVTTPIKVYWGNNKTTGDKQAWYIVGNSNPAAGSNASFVTLFCDPAQPLTTGVYDSTASSNHYGSSTLYTTLNDLATDTDCFSSAEQGKMKEWPVYNYNIDTAAMYVSPNKLYVPAIYPKDHKQLIFNASQGSIIYDESLTSSETAVDMTNANIPESSAFFTRPSTVWNGKTNIVLGAFSSSDYLTEGTLDGTYNIVPAFFLSPDNIALASSLLPESDEEATAMTLRYHDDSKLQSLLVVAADYSKATVLFDENDTNAFLMVQGKTPDGNAITYAKEITGDSTVLPSEVNADLGSFENCSVWIEHKDTDGLVYANTPTGCPHPSITDGFCEICNKCYHATNNNGRCARCNEKLVTYRNLDGKTVAATNYSIITDETILGISGKTTCYVLDKNYATSTRIIIQGNVNLILSDNCTWTAVKGIRVTGEDNSFTIWAQSEGDHAGALICKDTEKGDAGIGGDHTISATYEGRSSIIGENITINGGNITCYANYAAAIGGGYSTSGVCSVARNITINGGHVIAYSNESGPGIGAGGYYLYTCPYMSYCDGITINGGIIEAYGNKYNPGIGAGCSSNGNFAKNITINGGTIYAKGGTYASGIGAGYATYHGFKGGCLENMTINGGTIVSLSNSDKCPGIGAPYCSDGSVLSDDRVVWGTATRNLVINGGSVYADHMDGADARYYADYEANNPDYLSLLYPIEIKNSAGETVTPIKIQVTDKNSSVILDSTINTAGKDIISTEKNVIYLYLPQESFAFPTTGNVFLDNKYYYSISNNTVKAARYTGSNTFTLTGNQTIKTNRSLTVNSKATLVVPKGKTLTIQGQLNVFGKVSNKGKIVLAGGTYEDLKWANGSIEITGGKYATSPSKYLKLGYQAKKSNGYYVVSKIVRKKGDKIAVGNLKIQIIDPSAKTVAFYGVKTTTITSLTIPATVSIDGQTYKVTTISSNAFKACKKLKTITIKTTLLTSKTLTNTSFAGLGKGVTIKVPKAKYTSYKKLFKTRKLSSKVVIKKY